jgi:SAM-dependent methyltransferase
VTTPRADTGAAADGIRFEHRGPLQTILVEQEGRELRLKLLSPDSAEWQSRVDLDRPFELLSAYARSMMLALLWNERPRRAHVLGLGGGCIPSSLHRGFPGLLIDCTEIDPVVVEVARGFFGFAPDERLRVFVQDGRAFLRDRAAAEPYDIVFLDAFRGVGFAPLRLSSREFLQECRAQLAPGGVLVANVLRRGGLLSERVATFVEAFPHVTVHPLDGTLVLFGSDAPPPEGAERERLARAGAERLGLGPLLGRLAAQLEPAERWVRTREPGPARVLTDATPPGAGRVRRGLLRDVAAEADCPCGSGLRFGACHGG